MVVHVDLFGLRARTYFLRDRSVAHGEEPRSPEYEQDDEEAQEEVDDRSLALVHDITPHPRCGAYVLRLASGRTRADRAYGMLVGLP